MKITQEIIDDWTGPRGYSDLRQDHPKPCFDIIDMIDGKAILKYWDSSKTNLRWVAYAAKQDPTSMGRLGLRPICIEDPESIQTALRYIRSHQQSDRMVDPDMDLDEILLAQELIQKG